MISVIFITFALLALLNSFSNAFLQSTTIRSSSKLMSMSDTIGAEPISTPPVPNKPAPLLSAKWFPFLGVKAPRHLDGSLAADSGFDPLGLGKSPKTLYWMRDAEIKHARLAMLAAVGWPISELWHKNIAAAFGLESILSSNDRAPSLLNGGLSSVWASGMLVMSIIIAGYLEGKAMNDGAIFWNAAKPKDYIPGNYGFDPLGLINARKGNRKDMQAAEIKNGRLAMLAITAYAFQEFATGLPVIQETPYLF